jgi:hypothetical protein
MNRYSAALIHFFLCVAVGALLLALFWFVWYPAPTLLAIGGHQIFLLILGVDVVLGPLLTLVVFRPGKKSLKFDLFVIVTCQIAALVYGVSVLLEGRPAYVAALGDKFQVVQAVEVIDANLEKANTTLPWFGPKWVGTKSPTERAEIDQEDMLKSVGAGRGHMPQLHVSYESMHAEILRKAKPISSLLLANAGKRDEIEQWLKKRGVTPAQVVYQPFVVRASEFAIVLDASSARVVGIAPFKP